MTPSPLRGRRWTTRLAPLALLVFAMTNGVSAPVDDDYRLGVHAYQAKDYADARAHWERSVAAGDVLAKNNLGYLLFYGWGGPKDEDRGLALWREAAAAGVSESRLHLGTVYEKGGPVARSNVEAYAWYRCALASAEAREQDDETEADIADEARRALGHVLGALGADELPRAQALADDCIARRWSASSSS